MTHAHGHHDVVQSEGHGLAAGMLLAIAAIVLLAVIGLALLFTQPWADDGDAGISTDPVPGINEGGGTDGGGTGSEGGGTGGEGGGTGQ